MAYKFKEKKNCADGVAVTQSLFQAKVSGSTPTSALKRFYRVESCRREEVKDFIESWHYSHNINGVLCDYAFRLLADGVMVGACIYGKMAMANAYKKYVKKEYEIIELRRLCCIDNTEKNAESFFISKTLKMLKIDTKIKIVISYSDLQYGHKGTIYKASNFEFAGEVPAQRIIRWRDKLYHDKAIRTKYGGRLKPFAEKIKKALESGEAVYENTLPKLIWIYRLTSPPVRPEI